MNPSQDPSAVANTLVAPRVIVLLVLTAIVSLLSVDELAFRWSGIVASARLHQLAVVTAAFLVLICRRLPWRIAAVALSVSVGVLAFAALWPSAERSP